MSNRILGDEEANEFQDFDPWLDDNDSWQPPAAMLKFLDEYFNRVPLPEERQATLQDFPKPTCDVVQAPRLDNEVINY